MGGAHHALATLEEACDKEHSDDLDLPCLGFLHMANEFLALRDDHNMLIALIQAIAHAPTSLFDRRGLRHQFESFFNKLWESPGALDTLVEDDAGRAALIAKLQSEHEREF